MSNTVPAALEAGAKLYGTTDETAWYVTFVTCDTKHGQIRTLADGFFALCDKGALYIFHTDQVVHMSPQIPADQVFSVDRFC